jgi:hypothetical protein
MENEQVDLENLTQEDFLEMAKYCAYLEREIESVRANALAIVTQRDNAMKQLKQIQAAILAAQSKTTTVVKSGLDGTDLKLVNPEQWAVPADRVNTTPPSNKL